MNWDAVGAVSEIIGVLAVVATLLYLAKQLRREAITTTAASMDSWLSDYNNIVLELLRDPDVALIYRKGLTDFEQLKPNDQMRFHAWMVAHLLNAESMYIQLSEGIGNPFLVNQVLGFNAAMLKSNGGNFWWQKVKPIWNANGGFLEFVDAMIADAAPITEVWPWFSSDGE